MGGNTESLLTFEELLGAVDGVCIGEMREDFSFTSVATDSRNVKQGTLFVPLVGEFQDGHKYIPQALASGACAVFVTESVFEKNPEDYCRLASENPGKTFILVKNNLYALQNAASAYAGKFPDLIKIGITGSSGKTTTKEILSSLLSEKYNVVSTVGNFNSETGLPLSVFNIRREHEAGVFEMGMNRENEIGEIAGVLKPDYAIVTNIGTAHIGILGSRENIAREKKKIFDYIKEDGAAFIYAGDDFAGFLAEGVRGKVVRFGKSVPESGVDFISDDGIEGTRFSIDGIEMRLALPGVHNYENALSCILLARELGLSAEEIAAGIESVKLPGGRSRVVRANAQNGKNILLMDDCYNANPDSMEKTLELCASVKQRKIFVLGDMKELGTRACEEHSRIAGLAASLKPDLLVLAGSDMACGRESAEREGCRCVEYFEDASENNVKKITSLILDFIKDGDFILFKASHSMGFERIISALCGGEV